MPFGKFKKTELEPHLSEYWCISPKENAKFAARMKDILDIYERAYDPDIPVVYMDAKNYQLLAEAGRLCQCSVGMQRKQIPNI